MGFGTPSALLWLLGLPLIGGAVLWALAARARAAALLGDAALVRAAAAEVSPGKRAAKVAAAAAFVVFGAAALARPQSDGEAQVMKREGLDVVFLVDTSKSMLAADIAPNRLERVKLEIAGLLDGLKGNRVALVSFAGDAFTACPLTGDLSAFRMYLKGLKAGEIGRGTTNLGRALQAGLDLLENGGGRTSARVFVMLSDGEDHAADETAKALAALKEKGVTVFTAGVGSASGEPIPQPGGGYLLDKNGQPVISRRDDTQLARIADETKGSYTNLGAAGGLAGLPAAFARVSREAVETSLYTSRKEHFVWPLLVALLAALVLTGVDDRRAAGRGGAA